MPSIRPQYITAREQFGAERANALVKLFDQYQAIPVFNNRVGFASLYVTGRCHLECPHCYAEEEFVGMTNDAPIEQIMAIINVLCVMTERVQLTGGEIFVRADPRARRNDTLLIVDEISRRNREVIMQTTGMHITNAMLDFCVERNVKWFSLSIDGPDIESNNRIRGKDAAFTKTVALIPELKKRHFKVKVGTTVTSVTADLEKLTQLGHMLVELGVDNWKLTQFFGREAGRASGQNADWLSVPDETFTTIAEEMRQRFSRSMRVTTHSLADFSASPALLVQPTGIITVTQGTKDVFVGDALKDQPLQILNCLESMGGLLTILTNEKKTY